MDHMGDEIKPAGEFKVYSDPSDPSKYLLDWLCFDGGEVMLSEKDFDITKDNLSQTCDEVRLEGREKPIHLPKARLKSFDDLKNGMTVYSTWYDDSIVAMKVEGLDAIRKSAMGRLNEGAFGNLEFNSDIRGCWTCRGYTLINTSAIARVEFEP